MPKINLKQRVTGTAMALTLVLGGTLSAHAMEHPIMIEDQGSFFAGGRVVQSQGVYKDDNQPLLMIAGEKADTLYMTEDAYAKASGTENKELYMIEGASHIRTYWVPEYVDKAVNKLGDFFRRNL